MKLIKISMLSGSLSIAIATINFILPAAANPLQNNRPIGLIPLEIKDAVNPTGQTNLSPGSLPVPPNSPVSPNSSDVNPINNSPIQIFDPLKPAAPANIPDPQVDRKPLVGRTIPAASALVVSVPSDLQLDTGGATSITLILARAIFDDNGDEIAPVNSLVSARLQPDKGGVKIVADSLILRGKHIQIRASSAMYRGETTTTTSGTSKGDSFGLLGETLLRPFGDISLVGRGLGMIVGMFSPEQQTVVRIPQGTMFVLSLESQLKF